MLEYVELQNNGKMRELPETGPFKCVVLVSGQISPEWQEKVSIWLVNSGCLYMMAWGENCSSWDDSVDIANLERYDFDDIPDDGFVMTTWHSDEPLEDVLYFAKYTAIHSTIELERLVILDIGMSGRQKMLQVLYDQI